MRAGDRERLRTRYVYRCGYCGITEADAGSLLTVDHFHPVSQGGTDTPDNLVYCCHACNEFKGDLWNPGAAQRILHPLLDDVSAHVASEADGTLQGLTNTGRFHVEHLQLNRPPLLAHRLERQHREQQARRESDAAQRLQHVEEIVNRLLDIVEELRSERRDV
jgi:hypothetical protein